jgi:hypothetical protein
VANIFIEVKLREGRYHQNLGGEFREELGSPPDEFGKLKASEGSRQHDLPVELPKGNLPLFGQPRHQPGIGTVRAIQKQNPLALPDQARQEVVAKPGRVALTVKDHQALWRKMPGLS